MKNIWHKVLVENMKSSNFKGFETKLLLDDFGAWITNVMHERPSALTTLQRYPMKLRSWEILFFEVFFFLLISLWLDFVFVIATLEIFLPNHTWNIIISSKPYFVIIKTKINQTLVLHQQSTKIPWYPETSLHIGNFILIDYTAASHGSQFQDLGNVLLINIFL